MLLAGSNDGWYTVSKTFAGSFQRNLMDDDGTQDIKLGNVDLSGLLSGTSKKVP